MVDFLFFVEKYPFLGYDANLKHKFSKFCREGPLISFLRGVPIICGAVNGVFHCSKAVATLGRAGRRAPPPYAQNLKLNHKGHPLCFSLEKIFPLVRHPLTEVPSYGPAGAT